MVDQTMVDLVGVPTQSFISNDPGIAPWNRSVTLIYGGVVFPRPLLCIPVIYCHDTHGVGTTLQVAQVPESIGSIAIISLPVLVECSLQ